MRYFLIIAASLIFVGCAEYDPGDKVCNHRLGICEGEVMEISRGRYIVFFEQREIWPRDHDKLPDGRMAVSLGSGYFKTCEEDYYPNHPIRTIHDK